MAFSNYTPSPRPKNFGQAAQAPQTGENNSGQGPNTPVPDIVARKFNWGAFLLTFIWALGHRAYLLAFLMFLANLIYFIPLFGGIICLGLCIFFGVKGNTWAWQNKQFQSVDYFHQHERKWAIAGVVVSILVFVVTFTIVSIFAFSAAKNEMLGVHNKNAFSIHPITIQTYARMYEATEKKCDLSSNGLAMCFEEAFPSGERTGNSIKPRSYDKDTILVFEGNGVCRQEGDCRIIFQIGEGENQETADLPLYANDKGYIYIKDEDRKKLEMTE